MSESNENEEDSIFEDFDFNFIDEDNLDIAHDTFYPTKQDIIGIHDDIVSDDDDAEEGLFNDGKGKIEFTLQQVEGGIMGSAPETLHEKALLLFKRIASNHPFVDGNKRTALNATWTFYALNGYHFSYGEEIKAILKLFAVKEEMVDEEEVVSYFEDITYEAYEDRVPTYLAQFVHLTKWYTDMTERDFNPEELFENEVEEDDIEEFLNFFLEAYYLTVRLVSFRDKYEDELSEEFIEMVDSEESSINEFIETMLDDVIADMSKEEIGKIDGVEDREELIARLEFMKPKNVVSQLENL